MNDRHRRSKKSRDITFDQRDPDAPLPEHIEWSTQVLKKELQDLLIRCDLAPMDLLRGWDHGKDGCFSKKEVKAFRSCTHAVLKS